MKVILVDDERLALEYLERELMKLSNIEIIGKFTDPAAGREEALQKNADVVFLDISLPEISGIELAEQILESKPHQNIVFVTAYNEYAVKAFELNASDYIVKPIKAERLAKTIERIRERMELKPDESAASDNGIRMNVFKQVGMELTPGLVSILHWRTTKAQELFLYLLQHRGQLIRKAFLIELLWPEYEIDKVYSQLYTAVYHIRKTLDEYADYFQINNMTEGYILNINNVRLDVEEWESRLAALAPLTSNTIDDYIEVMKIYTGDYLLEYHYWWAESERQRLKQLWFNVSCEMAEWYRNQDILDKAVVCYTNICNQYPQDEKAYFALMKIYESIHYDMMVHRQYNSLTAALLEELNEQPSLYITEWYQQWEKQLSKS